MPVLPLIGTVVLWDAACCGVVGSQVLCLYILLKHQTNTDRAAGMSANDMPSNGFACWQLAVLQQGWHTAVARQQDLALQLHHDKYTAAS
jgi:hypothetical protein